MLSAILYLLGIPVRILKFLMAYIVRLWDELRSIIDNLFDYRTHHHHHHHHRHHHGRWTAGPLPEEPIMEKTRIAFCTTCKGRLQHLMQTIPENLKDNASYRNAVFVVVDYGGQDKLAEFCSENYPEEVKSGRLVVYTYPSQEPFKMAHAKNMAHRLGILEGGDILCNLDADNFLGPRFEDYPEPSKEELTIATRLLTAKCLELIREAQIYWMDRAPNRRLEIHNSHKFAAATLAIRFEWL